MDNKDNYDQGYGAQTGSEKVPPPAAGYNAPPYPNQGYPPQQGYPQQGYPQQGYGGAPQAGYYSGNTAVVAQPGQPGMMNAQGQFVPMPDKTADIIFSCVVTWCCCLCFGLAAFICAITSHSTADPEEAKRKLTLARRLSIAGLVIGIILWVLNIALRIVANVMASD